MPFGPDNIQRKGEASYKTIYMICAGRPMAALRLLPYLGI